MMLPLRYPREWRIASAALLLAVLVVALMPAFWIWGESRPVTLWFFEADKWMHGVTFAVLAMWFAGQYRRQSYWRIAMGLLAFGLLIEACQRLVGYRTADWSDVAADCVGICVGLLAGAIGAGGWAMYVESWLAGGAGRD
jgi:VanZ family protein